MLGLPADGRDYGIATSMLENLGITEVSVLTNNPNKIEQLRKYGISVASRIPLVVGVQSENKAYLETKVNRMGHDIKDEQLD